MKESPKRSGSEESKFFRFARSILLRSFNRREEENPLEGFLFAGCRTESCDFSQSVPYITNSKLQLLSDIPRELQVEILKHFFAHHSGTDMGNMRRSEFEPRFGRIPTHSRYDLLFAPTQLDATKFNKMKPGLLYVDPAGKIKTSRLVFF